MSGICGEICRYLLFIVLILGGFFVLGVTIVSISIAGINWNVTCDDTSFMSLPPWLVMVGVLSLLSAIALIFVYWFNRHNEYGNKLLVTFFIIVVIVTLFNGIGSGILFNYAQLCYDQAHSLWAMTLADLIFQWIIMLGGLITLIVLGCICCASCLK